MTGFSTGWQGPLRLADIVAAMSHALDMTEGLPAGHCLRCCWIGMRIGNALELAEVERSHLYYTLLLKDAGCSSNAARLFELYGADDREIKRAFKQVDSDSVFQLGRFVLSHAGAGKAMHDRIHRLLDLAGHGETYAHELIATRCERGAEIVSQLGFDQSVADGVRHLDEHWNGQGKPFGLRGEAIPLHARIALLAQVVEVFHAAGGPAAAVNEVTRRSGSWFDPELVQAFRSEQSRAGFWEGLVEQGLQQRVTALEPQAHACDVDEQRLDRIAEAFARVVDAKSPYTFGHSNRVAAYAMAVARVLGLAELRQRWLYRAALLHDIGKLGVSNSILDKPGRLDEEEWAKVRLHATYSEQILSRLHVFDELARVAGAHHERPDGKGYPRGLSGGQITLETRIITVADIFDAITAERPYRGPIPVADALQIMDQERGTAIDDRCLDALIQVLPELEAGGLLNSPVGNG